jgi:predicted secreted acid phosphatase
MKQFLLFLLLLCVMPLSMAEPSLNLSQQDKEMLVDRLSGPYLKEITRITGEAERYLLMAYRMNQQSATPQQLAVVFDVSNTALSNYKRIYENHRAADNASAIMKPAIPPVRNLYRVALEHHINVFFITSAKEHRRARLEANLKQVGYYRWSGLCMMPDDNKNLSVLDYKNAVRRQITKAGYKIILTMGDQETDIEGPNTGQKYKLPDITSAGEFE